ncbi:winged helix DNA-binding protein [Parahaliea mediterranea]|uniref:Winged helix DNA-binding protein n=1 Tax=Parahaliea mediterranea TaxID=651086 RepID=A0A939DCB2_9GAMM|nr:winged helix DNA-binding protein [Parahaliea mediterranea]MBN7795575.1 winged helix DNA-binding protein [Parahaliea mediterranea]
MKKEPEERFDKHWHLATDDHEIAVAEVEFSIFRIFSAFNRWMDDLTRCCQGDAAQACSGIDFSLLNVIRMHDRPKGISELGRLMNRDDMSNLQYSIRKLIKAGLIEKLGAQGHKKGVTYRTTAQGDRATDLYASYRREILVPLTRSVSAGDERMIELANLLTLLSGIYDQAACVAATHREI